MQNRFFKSNLTVNSLLMQGIFLESHSYFYFCEPRQCAKNGNHFIVNVNSFSLTFQWLPQILLKISISIKIWQTFIFCKFFHFQGVFFLARVPFLFSRYFCSRLTPAISLHAQVLFYAKYPFFDSQSDRGYAMSCYAMSY